jgi:hypothetical protein
MIPAEYHPLDNPEKRLGLHYSLFRPSPSTSILENTLFPASKNFSRRLNPPSRANLPLKGRNNTPLWKRGARGDFLGKVNSILRPLIMLEE